MKANFSQLEEVFYTIDAFFEVNIRIVNPRTVMFTEAKYCFMRLSLFSLFYINSFHIYEFTVPYALKTGLFQKLLFEFLKLLEDVQNNCIF